MSRANLLTHPFWQRRCTRSGFDTRNDPGILYNAGKPFFAFLQDTEQDAGYPVSPIPDPTRIYRQLWIVGPVPLPHPRSVPRRLVVDQDA